MMQTSLESGFRSALTDFILMQFPLMDFILMHLQLAPVFFTFSLATKIHYYGNTFSENLTWTSKPQPIPLNANGFAL